MTVFFWTDNLQTGIEKVDAQHRRLVDMLNELDEARVIGGEQGIMLELLGGLVDYTRYHFETEETLMAAPGFDAEELQRHRSQHNAFIDKVAEVRIQANENPSLVGGELLDFLVRWLTEHILGTDQRMAQQLRTNNPNLCDSRPLESADSAAAETLIRALRESESRFRGLADSVPTLIWMSDRDGRRSYVNQQWSKFTGLQREQLTNTRWLESLHPDDRQRMGDLHTAAHARESETVAEFRLRRADGKYRWFWETTVPRQYENGKFLGAVGCAFDITERRQVERLLRSAKQRLESMVAERTQELTHANGILEQRYREQEILLKQLKDTQTQLLQSEKMAGIGQLAAGVAHEINNPISYVYSNLSTLKTYSGDLFRLLDAYEHLEHQLPADSPARETLSAMKQEVDLDFLRDDVQSLVDESMDGAIRAKQIVQNLKDFSRIDHQELAPFDLEEGLNTTLNIAQHDIHNKADILKEYSGLNPVMCIGAEMNQVFMNLIVNAAQAMREHGTIRIRTGQNGGSWVWVEIEDNGQGIPEDKLSRLFDPFFTTKPIGQGTGMGLSLSYAIVKKHGGRIEVTSRLKQGSRFRIRLPTGADEREHVA